MTCYDFMFTIPGLSNESKADFVSWCVKPEESPVSAPEKLAAFIEAAEPSILPMSEGEQGLAEYAVFAKIVTDEAHLGRREKAGLLLLPKSSSNLALALATGSW